MTKSKPPKQHIWVYNYPGVLRSAVAGTQDLFDIANRFAGETVFYVDVIDSLIDRATELSDKANILFVPPCLDEQHLPALTETSSHLRTWFDSGATIAATCASVFWLAEAGLLNGKVATTHWQLYDRLASEYPLIKSIDRRNMVVDQGSVISAAGLYAFQDLVLHLVAKLTSYDIAKQVADFALLDFNGRLQSYYQRFIPNVSHGDMSVLAVQRYCEQVPTHELSVKAMAEQVHVSERTLNRRFQHVLSMTPGEYLLRIRIEKSKQLLDASDQSIEQIAYDVGYNDFSNFSKAFKRMAGVTPAEFRQRAHA